MMTTEQGRTAEADLSLLPVGSALRARREQLGWSLADVAAWLRIKLSYLEALEGGQVAKLPGTAYAMGFLRAYAGALGLDADDMSRRFRHETKDLARRPELSFPAPVPERGVPAGAVVLLGVVVVVAAYAGWYELTGHERRLARAVPPVPAALMPYAGPATAPTPSPQVATVMPGPGQTPSPLPPGSGIPAGSTAPATPGDRVAGSGAVVAPGAPGTAGDPALAKVPPAASVPAQAVLTPRVPGEAPQTGPIGSSAPTAPVSPPGQISVDAVAGSWVQVRNATKVLYDHVMAPGESWAVPQDAGPLTLTTGNAGGVKLAVDGVTSPVLGRPGAVRRAIPLSAASIKDGTIAGVVPGASGSGDAAPAGAPAAAPDATTAGAVTAPVRKPPAGVSRPHEAAQPDDAADRLNEQQLNRLPPR